MTVQWDQKEAAHENQKLVSNTEFGIKMNELSNI